MLLRQLSLSKAEATGLTGNRKAITAPFDENTICHCRSVRDRDRSGRKRYPVANTDSNDRQDISWGKGVLYLERRHGFRTRQRLSRESRTCPSLYNFA